VTTLLYPLRAVGFNEGSALFFSVAELLLLLCSVYFEHNLLDPCALFQMPIGEDLVLCYPPPMPHRREFACIASLDLCANLRGGHPLKIVRGQPVREQVHAARNERSSGLLLWFHGAHFTVRVSRIRSVGLGCGMSVSAIAPLVARVWGFGRAAAGFLLIPRD